MPLTPFDAELNSLQEDVSIFIVAHMCVPLGGGDTESSENPGCFSFNMNHSAPVADIVMLLMPFDAELNSLQDDVSNAIVACMCMPLGVYLFIMIHPVLKNFASCYVC